MCSWWFSWKEVIISSDNGLAPTRRQAFIFTNDGLIYWHIYASRCIDELSGSLCRIFRKFTRYSESDMELPWSGYVILSNKSSNFISASITMFSSSRYSASRNTSFCALYDDVIKWKHFPRPPVNSLHKRPLTRSFGVLFDLCLNQWLRKQSWGWWFETLSRPLWRHLMITVSLLMC